MGSKVKKNAIRCTRGDSFWVTLNLTNEETGEEYIPDPNDYILFSLKTSTDDDETPIVTKEISPENLEIILDPEDTDLDPGTYYYDVEITLTNGFVCTVIEPTKFVISEQVGDKRRWP